MTSWRDDASDQAQEDLDQLVTVGLGFAQDQLAKHGEFFPYGAVIDLAGEGEFVAGVADDGDEHPDSVELIEVLVGGLRERRDEVRATAIVANVTVAGGDAISVELEHSEGIALRILMPYAKKRIGRRYAYGELQAAADAARIWG